MEVLCKYSLFYYSKEMIEFLFNGYMALLEEIVAHPARPVADLQTIPAKRRDRT
jgi:hypothetical protein